MPPSPTAMARPVRASNATDWRNDGERESRSVHVRPLSLEVSTVPYKPHGNGAASGTIKRDGTKPLPRSRKWRSNPRHAVVLGRDHGATSPHGNGAASGSIKRDGTKNHRGAGIALGPRNAVVVGGEHSAACAHRNGASGAGIERDGMKPRRGARCAFGPGQAIVVGGEHGAL